MRVFVSSCRIDDIQASSLIQRLASENFQVWCSPRNPHDGKDERWRDWYTKRCQDELDKVDIFIAVVNKNWAVSTWMLHELYEARKRLKDGVIRNIYCFNPEHFKIDSINMEFHPPEQLPDEIDDVVKLLQANHKSE